LYGSHTVSPVTGGQMRERTLSTKAELSTVPEYF
jgi:hypothetical protein